MTNWDERLADLQAQQARKQQLETKVRQLEQQAANLQPRVQQLAEKKASEQADVDRLEGRSLAHLYYHVIGRAGEQLDKERREAYEAAVRYDAARRELDAVEDDIARLSDEIDSLADCDARYAQALKEKQEAIRASGQPEAAKVLELQTALGQLRRQRKEIEESIEAGENACAAAKEVLSALDGAAGMGMWDMLGGGMIVTALKYDHLDNAQAATEELQIMLTRFRTELADVDLDIDGLHVDINGFLCFADYFFDGLFADLAVQDRINQSASQVEQVWRKVEDVLDRLHDAQDAVTREMNQTWRTLENLTVQTAVKHPAELPPGD